MDNRAMDSKNYYQVLASLFHNPGRQQGQGRPQRQAPVSAPAEFDGPVDCVTWSKGLFQAINSDLGAVWAI